MGAHSEVYVVRDGIDRNGSFVKGLAEMSPSGAWGKHGSYISRCQLSVGREPDR